MNEAERQAKDVTAFASTSLGKMYGAAWGDPESAKWLRPVLYEFMLPQVSKSKRLCEIGSGGGRWSRYMILSGKPTLLIDGSPSSEVLIRSLPWTEEETKHIRTNIDFLVSPTGTVPDQYCGAFDYIFSFDTFVHFDLSLLLQYLRTISRMLVPGGVLHLHYADLMSSRWFAALDKADEWWSACESFRYVGRLEMEALLKKFGLHFTGRELTWVANGSRLIECMSVSQSRRSN